MYARHDVASLCLLLRRSPAFPQAAANAALAQTPAGKAAALEARKRRKKGLLGRPRPGALNLRLSTLKGRSLWLFAPAPESPIRRFLFQIIDDKRFEAATMAMILFSSLSMAVESPKTMTIDAVVKTLYAVDVISTSYFALEFAMKVVVLGFIFDTNAYLREPWNILDGGVVFLSVLALSFGNSGFSWVRFSGYWRWQGGTHSSAPVFNRAARLSITSMKRPLTPPPRCPACPRPHRSAPCARCACCARCASSAASRS